MPTPQQNQQTLENVDLKNRNLAAVLAFLIPGAGHFYQARWFKGAIYSFCILGTFFCGVALGEGRSVYLSYYNFIQTGPRIQDQEVLKKRNYGYLSQVLVGLPSLPAVIQAKRFEGESNQVRNYLLDLVDHPESGPFEGMLITTDDVNDIQSIAVKGSLTVQGEIDQDRMLTGRLKGTVVESGEQIELLLSDRILRTGSAPLGGPISADPQRLVDLWVDDVVSGPESLKDANLFGSIPRPFWNWYQVPLEDQQLQDLNRRLGKQWEMGMVFTWIAGLLNILAIWDAYEGPAYGVRPLVRKDEDDDSEPSSEQKQSTSEVAPSVS